MLTYDLKGKNKYYTLYSFIRGDILNGKISAGEKLPSKRSLAEDLGVSVVTVQLAYEQLLAEGYIVSRERSGYYVEKVAGGAVFPKTRVAFHEMGSQPQKTVYALDFVKGATPAEMFPFSVWARLMRAVLADCGEHLLDRVPCDGDYELKNALSRYLYRTRGIEADPRRIVIGAGAEYLYGIIVQLLGRDRIYAVENPGYVKISSAYGLNGARIAAVGVGGGGMNIDNLIKSGASVAHVSPSHQFPTGAVMPAAARLRLIEWAKAGDRYVVEDDYDSEFRLTGKPLQCTYALHPEKVIYMNTFSKSLAPSMRMGYMVLPAALYERFIKIFGNSASIVPLFEQKALAAMIEGGYFERHIQRLKNYYRGIRTAVREKFCSLSVPCELFDTGSGLHMVAHFPSAPDDDAIREGALVSGARIKCLSDYLLLPAEGFEKRAVINYSGVTKENLKNFDIKF